MVKGSLTLLAVLIPATLQASTTVTVVDVDGRTHVGALVAIDAERLVIEAGRRVELSIADLVRLQVGETKPPGRARGAAIVLQNGDRLAAEPIELKDERIVAAWSAFPAWPPVAIPLETIRGAILQSSRGTSALGDDLRFLSSTGRNSDLLILSNGDRLAGEFLDLKGEQLSLKTTVGDVKVPREGVRLVAFNPELIAFPKAGGPRALLTLSDGSRITVRNLSLKADEVVSAEALFGAMLEVPLAAVSSLQFLGGRAVYLSDLEPAEYHFTPYLSQTWDLQRDRNVSGGPLRLRGREYAKGLGMHSRSVVTYRLDGEFRRFQAVVGIDDEAGGQGSVLFAVEVDGRRVYESDAVTGKSDPLPIGPLDLSGAKTLTLIVEFGDFGDVLDHADWCDALLVK